MPIFRFDDFELDTDAFELRSAGDVIALEPQVFALLQFLIEQRDRVVSKDEIINEVWDGRIISDTALNTRIGSVRKALGDDGKKQAIVRTFPRRGFRFIAELDDEKLSANQSVPVTSEKPSIAVLPFNNLSGDPEQEYFSDGITEDIITALSRIRQFFVIARGTTFTYKGQAADIQVVAKELGVRYVLEGSVRKAGVRVRITAQLIDGETGKHLWAEKYDRELEDIFAVQDEITQTVVSQISPELEDAEIRRARRNPPVSLDAWGAYVRGLPHYYLRTKESLVKAQEYFMEAIKLDPALASAYAYSAQAYGYMGAILGDPERRTEYRHRGFDMASKALELDPEDPDARLAMGQMLTMRKEHHKAIQQLEEAVRLNPSSGLACRWMGAALMFIGSAHDALPHFKAAVELSSRDPLRGPTMGFLGFCYLCLEEFEEATIWAERALREPTTRSLIRVVLISALGHLGRNEEAVRAHQELQEAMPNVTPTQIIEATGLEDEGYKELLIDGLIRAGVDID